MGKTEILLCIDEGVYKSLLALVETGNTRFGTCNLRKRDLNPCAIMTM